MEMKGWRATCARKETETMLWGVGMKRDVKDASSERPIGGIEYWGRCDYEGDWGVYWG